MTFLWIAVCILAGIAAVMTLLGIIRKPDSVYKNKPEEQNPMEGKQVRFVENENEKANADGARGHLEAVGATNHKPSVYEKVF